jgi:Family of unknown function (DUF6314)
VGSTLDFLTGEWNVARLISDFRTGRSGVFRGTASFRPAGDTGADPAGRALSYCEEGELEFGEHRGPARRSLLLHSRDDGGADVRFADGREFFRLDLRSGSCEAVHPCRDDQYRVTVTRLTADSFTETWRVSGPAKDYQLRATYTRAGAAE